ncbi:hypothetical protein OIU76_016571 [Salix suchowensis]|nr:hypothetical protein OIU76_016571 [Salix suchowensis]
MKNSTSCSRLKLKLQRLKDGIGGKLIFVCPKNTILAAVLSLPSQDLQGWTKKFSPLCISSSTSMPKAIERLNFVVLSVTNALKERNNLCLKLAGILLCAFLVIPSADAVDALKTCTCLLKECRLELAKCIANPSCAANVACLQTCNNRPDETECQIKCGDLFENSVVDEFNECAVSRKKCVPRKSDVGEFPCP